MFESIHTELTNLNHGNVGGSNSDNLPAWLPIMREFCFNVTLCEDFSFNERMFIIGMFLKQAEQHINNTIRLEQMVNSYIEMANDGTLQKMFADLSPVSTLKWQIFYHQDRAFIASTKLKKHQADEESLSISDTRFNECRQQLLTLLKENKANADQGDGEFFEKILQNANDKILPAYFKKNPQILINYVLYYLYHYQFMYKEGKSPFEFYRIMIVDLFMLTSYLAGIALQQDTLNNESVTKLFQSYSRRRQHRVGFIEIMEEQLKKAGSQGAGSIFALLK